MFKCFDCVVKALEALPSCDTDSKTVVIATNLLKRIDDFELIVCLFILRKILNITGPVSRLLQGVACDLEVALTLVKQCLSKFTHLRQTIDNPWQNIVLEAKKFASSHDIQVEFPKNRLRKEKRMPGERAVDE